MTDMAENRVPPAPARFGMPGGILQWINRLRGREFDTYTGEWVRLGWIEERQALAQEAKPLGTCMNCGQPAAIHPPERMWSADPALCPPRQETIGELHDRLPPNEWVNLPEYDIRAKRIEP